MTSAPALLMAEKKETGRQKDTFQLILTFDVKPDIERHRIVVRYPELEDSDNSLRVFMLGSQIYSLALPGDVQSGGKEKVSGNKLIITMPKLDQQSWIARGRCSPSRGSSDSSS